MENWNNSNRWEYCQENKILGLENPATFSVKNTSQFIEDQLRNVDHCGKSYLTVCRFLFCNNF